MPMGVATTMATTVMATEPKMALSRPPSEPGGGVFSMKIRGEIAENPWMSRVTRIAPRKNRPTTVAAVARPSIMVLVVLRELESDIALPLVAFGPGEQPFGDAQNREGNDEKDAAE